MTHAPDRKELTPAGQALAERLASMGWSQQRLVDEINRVRAEGGVTERLGRSNVYRWMIGEQSVNLDDATRIQALTGLEVERWFMRGAGVDALAPTGTEG